MTSSFILSRTMGGNRVVLITIPGFILRLQWTILVGDHDGRVQYVASRIRLRVLRI